MPRDAPRRRAHADSALRGRFLEDARKIPARGVSPLAKAENSGAKQSADKESTVRRLEVLRGNTGRRPRSSIRPDTAFPGMPDPHPGSASPPLRRRERPGDRCLPSRWMQQPRDARPDVDDGPNGRRLQMDQTTARPKRPPSRPFAGSSQGTPLVDYTTDATAITNRSRVAVCADKNKPPTCASQMGGCIRRQASWGHHACG